MKGSQVLGEEKAAKKKWFTQGSQESSPGILHDLGIYAD